VYSLPVVDVRSYTIFFVIISGIKYDMSSLDEDQCPTQYSMKTYNSEQELLEDEAEMTHWGAC
jgi:hypothetical protein